MVAFVAAAAALQQDVEVAQPDVVAAPQVAEPGEQAAEPAAPVVVAEQAGAPVAASAPAP